MVKGRVLVVIAGVAVAAVALLTPAIVRVWQFKDRYVMVTVEESSTSAVVSWPLLTERLPGSFVDASTMTISLQEVPRLFGVSLCVHYTATSQGIEISDSARFSRTGKAVLRLDRPLSYISDSLDGGRVELVDNRARVLAGRLAVEKTFADGSVRFTYGDRRITLKPGESWAELLVLAPEGPKPVDPANWELEFRSYMELGYPATRLAVANRGFWPKSGVVAGIEI